MMLIPGTVTQAGGNLDIQVTPGHAGLRRRRRPEQRGAHPGGWPEHRRRVQRRRRVELRAGHRQRAGDLDDDVRRPRRSGSRRTHRSASCRRPAATPCRASIYQSNVTKGMVGNNYTHELKSARVCRRPASSSSCGTSTSASAVRSRRTGSGSSASSAIPGQPPHDSRHVRQQEPGRPDQVDLLSGHDAVRPSRPEAGATPRCA